MKKKQLKILIACFLLLSVFGIFLMSISEESMTYYHTSGEVLRSPDEFKQKKIRVMGLVKENSVEWDHVNTILSFEVTDDLQSFLKVSYKGLRPDMFGEGQGVVAQGKLNHDGVLVSDQLLVKHTEEYKTGDDTKMRMDEIIKSLNKEGI